MSMSSDDDGNADLECPDHVAGPLDDPLDEDGIHTEPDSVGPVASGVDGAGDEGAYVPAAARLEITTTISSAIEGIRDAHAKAAATGHAIADKTISLIVSGPHVMWVRWTDAVTWECRQVTLRGVHNVIQAIVPINVPKKNVHGCRVVIHNVPAVMLMRKPTEGADRMPAWCMLLYVLEQARIYSGPLHVAPLDPQCAVCDARPGLGIASDGTDVYRCQACACLWHLRCAKAFCPDITDEISDENFKCPVCLLDA